MALEFEIETAVTVDCCEPLYELACLVMPAARQRRCNRAFVASGEADQSGGELFEVFKCGRALCLFCLAHLETCDELAEVLIAVLRCTEQYDAWRLVWALMRQPRCRREVVADRANCDLCADIRFNPGLLC